MNMISSKKRPTTALLIMIAVQRDPQQHCNNKISYSNDSSKKRHTTNDSSKKETYTSILTTHTRDLQQVPYNTYNRPTTALLQHIQETTNSILTTHTRDHQQHSYNTYKRTITAFLQRIHTLDLAVKTRQQRILLIGINDDVRPHVDVPRVLPFIIFIMYNYRGSCWSALMMTWDPYRRPARSAICNHIYINTWTYTHAHTLTPRAFQ